MNTGNQSQRRQSTEHKIDILVFGESVKGLREKHQFKVLVPGFTPHPDHSLWNKIRAG